MEQRHYVIRIRVASEHRFREHEVAVDVNVEDAVFSRHDLHGADRRLEFLENARRQTDSVWTCPSGHAVFDADDLGIGHGSSLAGAVAG